MNVPPLKILEMSGTSLYLSRQADAPLNLADPGGERGRILTITEENGQLPTIKKIR